MNPYNNFLLSLAFKASKYSHFGFYLMSYVDDCDSSSSGV